MSDQLAVTVLRYAVLGKRIRDRPATGKIALAIGVFFACLYLLTMSGHTSSSDEEMIYYVARSLADHQGLDVPFSETSTTGLPIPSPGGKYYSPTGLVPSVMALPFIVVGDRVAE